jgi:hypothetical protein
MCFQIAIDNQPKFVMAVFAAFVAPGFSPARFVFNEVPI